ncbi:MAG: TetR/AcrR family transcriptional regulator [Chthoniobacter sp.]|nr:TetR/AcrR family transcriptional regulator [Chthoniobacter sp.]
MNPPAASRGRPRAFDSEVALQRALELFWRQGYEGTSLSDLTAAMGINRPSLYAAFGNKEQLFRKALERYLSGPAACFAEALQQSTARAVSGHLLQGVVNQLGDPKSPGGCLVVQAALSSGTEADPIRQVLAAHRNDARHALRRRFQRAITAGDLPAGTKAGDLASYLMAVVHGLAVQAAGGLSRKELQAVADLALRTWPP